MSKKTPSAPAAPDPAAQAEAQARANRITQFTPQGNLVFGKMRGIGNEEFLTERKLAGTKTVGEWISTRDGQQFVERQEPVFEEVSRPNPDFDPNRDPFSFVPDNDHAALRVEESPFQEAIRGLGEGAALNLGVQALDQSGNLPTNALTTAGLPALMSNIDMGSAPALNYNEDGARRMEAATFNRAMGLLDPVFERRENRVSQDLANRGIPEGSEQFSDRWRDERQFQNEALSNLALQSIGAGRAEQSRQFGLSQAARGQSIQEQLASAGLGQTARQIGLQERVATRQNAFNELATLLGLNQVNPISLNSFVPPGAVDVTGPQQMAQANALAQQQMANQQNIGNMSGLFGLGAAGISAISDIRMKEDIKRVGSMDNGLPVYTFRYRGDPMVHMGVMAQEVEQVNPDAVVEIGGIKHVQYGRL